MSVNFALVDAAKAGDLEAVRKLLAGTPKPDLDFEDIVQGTALAAAVSNGHSEVVKLILDQYPDPQAKRLVILKNRNLNSLAALNRVDNSNPETLKVLLDCFEPPERLKIISENYNGQNLFRAIASNSKPEMLELLLSYYPDPASRVKAILEENSRGNNAIYLAAEQQGSADGIHKVKLLLSHFPNPREIFIKEIEKKDFALFFQNVGWDSPVKVQFLLSHYPNITERLTLLSKKNPEGHTPLSYARYAFNENMVKYLLSEGCFVLDNKELMEFDNLSVPDLHRKKKSNIVEIFKRLERVFSAAKNEGSELSFDLEWDIQQLTTAVNARSPSPKDKGNSPLHFAILNKNMELILVLLQNGARTDIPNADGKTPFDLAMESEKKPLVVGFLNLFRALELKKELENRQETQVKGREGKEQEEKLYTEQQMLRENFKTAALASRSLLAADLTKSWYEYDYLEIADVLAPVDTNHHLAGPPIDAVGAYTALSKIPRNSPKHRVANLRMYDLLSGAVALLPPAEKGQAPIPVPGSALFEQTQAQETKTEKDKPRIVSLDEEDEAESTQQAASAQPAPAKSIDKTLTLEYQIRHLLYSFVKEGQKEFNMIGDKSQAELRQELFSLIAIYVYDLDMKPQLGEIMFKFIADDSEARTPTTFMAMLKSSRAVAKTNPHDDALPTITAEQLKPYLPPAKPLVTQYKAGIQQPDTPGKPPASPRTKLKAP